MTTPAEAVAALPVLQWRGLEAPCLLAPFDFSHSQAERRYPYIDGAGHDNTGRDPLHFQVRLAFLETVEPGAFTDNWPLWRAALFDGSSGPLRHPILGKVQARVLNTHVDLKAETRAGIFVDVTFTETRDTLTGPAGFTPADVGLDAAVAAADENAAQFGISYPDGEGTTTLGGAFNSIKGQLFSAGLSVTGAINQVIGNVDAMIASVEALDDASAWPAYDALTAVYAGLLALAKTAEQAVARSVAQRTTSAPTTLDAFATETGNTLTEVMGLNLNALRSPIVAKGTTLFYYSGR